ncbi:S-layer homology domain-containing protein [Paenibacillus sp. MMS18-CY102]|uniref:S-layer homology domain-containing protein n=1 Tax=Paenibacillus sp. MMS18-CY102 TaxID=2682849 RepID=UPI0013654FB9|nr:S-layer homology domain-containing protein [Paenibacillus sp. MMS18-CY102]MWC27697.1 hypothetical protein [Paenibacillus sp. MMS18-CY102]
MKKFRSVLSALLAVSLVFGTLLASVSAASSPENVEKHWAAGTLKKWLAAGLIQGYPDGTLKPDAPVTRGEFAALLNRAFGLKDEAAGVSFNDLPKANWAYHDIAVAVQAGYLQGTGGGNVSPAQAAARQEASVMVANILHLDTKTNTDVSQFKDAAQIADWSKGSVAALASNKIVKGDEQGNFRPKASITRAEAVVVLDAALALQNNNSVAKTFDKAGVYGSADKTETINGNVVISAAGVTLQNVVITGNLTIAKEVAEGDVTLKKVTVKGTTTVNGGGPNSIHLEDSVLLRIIVDKATGRVRIVAIGATTVQDVIIQSPVKIEESHVTDSGFKNIEISKALPKDSNVELVGHFESVGVNAANIQLNIPSGKVDNLDVAKDAAGNVINVSKEAQVLKLVLDAVAKLIGEGKVDQATVNDGAKGSSFETKPGQVDGAAKDSITAPGATVVTGGGGGGSTGGNNGGNNNGGNTGGNNGGDNGGSTPPKCTVNCDDANLHSLSVAGSVYMELAQRNFGTAKVGVGFESMMQDYSVDLPSNFAESDVAFTVTAAAYATISYSVDYDDGNEIKDVAVGDQGSFNIHLREKHDATVMVTVTNANDNQSKYYYVKFVYDRGIQEAFRIDHLVMSPTQTYNILQSEALMAGDSVTATVPAADTSKGLELTVSGVSGQNGSSAFGVSLADYSKNNVFKPANLIGTIHVVVTRAGQEIMNGDYQYDLTPVPLITDGTGINVTLWTKEQLKQKDATSYSVNRASYGIDISFDKVANPALQNVKYIEVAYGDKLYTNSEKYAWTYEDRKKSQVKYGFRGPIPVSDDYPYNVVPQGYTEVHDQFAYIFLYDEHKKLIGCYVQELHFDADHVGEGVTIVPPVVK